MPNRLGTADQAVCENCGGTVIVYRSGFVKSINWATAKRIGVLKGGKCRDCGARYNQWNVAELQPRPKFTGGVRPQEQRRITNTLKSRETTAEPCSCGHLHFITLSSASQVCTGVCAPHAYTTGTSNSNAPAAVQTATKPSQPVDRWFYYRPETKDSVAVTGVELTNLIAQGTIPAGTSVWRAGMQRWTPIERTREFGHLVRVEARGPNEPAAPVRRHLPWIIAAVLVIASWTLYIEALFWLSLIALIPAVFYGIVQSRLQSLAGGQPRNMT